ncbi:UNVERIFIED_CONTAM: putative beta-1,4-xylosyltransferase IRX10L [Sesamum calycinum]|uniref:Beta-1,4-xylosyltransferase IRX10L n=1 Tax=Sesamum calycinum TaxID=2727403 RepID=A0AAW2SXW5_9LAMI
MRNRRWVFTVLLFLALCLRIQAFKFHRTQRTERISGSAGDVLEDDPVGRLKVFVYELPSKYNKKILQKDPRCLTHMFAAEIYMHRFLLSSAVRTLNPEEADWFYTPVYTTCDLTPNGLPLPFKSPRMMRSAIQLISSNWPYWNRTEGADHFFIVPHDFGACFHYQEEKAIERGILPLLQRATLVQTFGQRNHVCLKDGSITIPPYAPPQKMQTHLIPPSTPRSIFVYFRGLFMMSEMTLKVVIMQAWGCFHQILNGLARKLPHDASVYLKTGEKALNWTAGPVGDLKPWITLKHNKLWYDNTYTREWPTSLEDKMAIPSVEECLV